jgi:hypothetical protein
MTLSTGKIPYQVKNTKPLDPNVQPIGEWTTANRGCYERFRRWMVATGLRPCTVQSYAIGARFVLGFLKKPYWVIDPEDDVEQVWEYLQRSFDSPSRLTCYRKGMLKFRQYMAMIQDRPEKPKAINWDYQPQGTAGRHRRDHLQVCAALPEELESGAQP